MPNNAMKNLLDHFHKFKKHAREGI